jgi:hypothetical protein
MRFHVSPEGAFPVPPLFLPLEGLGPAFRALEESGFGSLSAFAIHALRASSSNTLPIALPRHPFLRTSRRFAAVAVAGC